MARLIVNRSPISPVIFRFYQFVMRELRDYIFALFDATFIEIPESDTSERSVIKYVNVDESGNFDYDDLGLSMEEFDDAVRSRHVINYDAILLIPHLGCFIVAVYSGIPLKNENGQAFIKNKMGMHVPLDLERRHKFVVRRTQLLRRFLKQKFNHMPHVYEVTCYPDLFIDGDSFNADTFALDPDHILINNDMHDENSFLSKLYSLMIYALQETQDSDQQWQLYDDLTDQDASFIFRSWIKDIPAIVRPDKPPIVFLSYNSKNRMRAQEIKEQLEERGVFVWRAPEDVPISDYYLDVEMQAIADCSAFLILMSHSSQVSYEVKIEFEEAVRLNKRIIPLIIEDFEMNEYYTKGLTKYQFRDLIQDNPAVIDEIVRIVSG